MSLSRFPVSIPVVLITITFVLSGCELPAQSNTVPAEEKNVSTPSATAQVVEKVVKVEAPAEEEKSYIEQLTELYEKAKAAGETVPEDVLEWAKSDMKKSAAMNIKSSQLESFRMRKSLNS